MSTLIINRSDSKCDECGRNADPKEDSHETVWTANGIEGGCGVTYTHVHSHYSDHDGLEESIKRMRPDLELIPLFKLPVAA